MMKIIVTLKFYPSTKRQTYLIVSLNHNSAADHDKASMASANTAVIIFGGFVALVAVIFLFFILDCIKSYFNRQSIDITVSPTTIKDTWSNFKLTDLADDEDETRILVEEEMPMVSSSTFGDEFQTKTQECLVVILNDETRIVGICAYLNDRNVEFFLEELPSCCIQNSIGKDNCLRCVMTGVSYWADKWCYAEAISLLCQDRNTVKALNTPGTRQRRKLTQFEERYEFRTFPQWTDNYTCDNICHDDLWEDIINLARILLRNPLDEKKQAKAWKKFALADWDRKRKKPSLEHFHHVPHVGKVVESEKSKIEPQSLVTL